MKKLQWGVLGVAKIATEKVIPAMQRGTLTEIAGIASRGMERARQAAEKLGIAKAYGGYQELLEDPEIDAVYIPLPNHLHVPWSLRALEAGKHVLCEKPLAPSAAAAAQLLEACAGYPRQLVMEAFMYRFHPQWTKARELARDGTIGELKLIQSHFSYFNRDPANIRNIFEMGGGGLLDIGCYPVSVARFIFDREPDRVVARIEPDPTFGVDRLASAILDFGSCAATFTCGTQIAPYQRVHIHGEKGRIEIEIPFNAPPDRACRYWVQRGEGSEEFRLGVCDQYTIQGDLFSKAVRDKSPPPTPLSDAVANLRVLDALVESARTGEWQRVEG